jgi:diaminohydroxyphosphoribosylaminopyrimidine deaminase/5-amino-6-(5-phosphoribosylamino)uracil reductase
VYALPDPLPRFAGGGAYLAAAGVQVQADLGAPAARALHRPWLTAATRGRPYATLKLAATLDGRAAAADGSSQWITGPAARADAHALRGRVDAILVGSGTVLADNPALTVRGTAEPRRPLRVVLDRRGRVPATALALDGQAPSLTTSAGPDELTAELFTRGIRHLLIEGGPTVAGAFLAAGLVDELVVYLAPALLGAGPAALMTAAFPSIGDAVRWQFTDITQVSPDLRLTARPLEG